jgi:peptidoglycan/xylan/chitin deacetylase (PgdA/CDA1 family)/SAM-dependent methyltransferase
MHISVIMPALNAAATIAEAIASLQAQTHRDWEVIVVDNGSSDETAAVVANLAESDQRIRSVDCARRGVSAARNEGIRASSYDWLMFLDADDTLAEEALEKLSHRLSSPEPVDVSYCGWVRIAPDGEEVQGWHTSDSTDLFPDFATACAFAIHACAVRKELVTKQGGFDEELVTCEDWDLWQRLARAGARFGMCEGFLAHYRMRAASASNQSLRLVQDGVEVILRGHSADPRVVDPVPKYAAGQDPVGVPRAVLTFSAFAAGPALAVGGDLDALLAAVSAYRAPAVAPQEIADCIFIAALPAAGIGPSGWSELLPRIQPRLEHFLARLEQISGSPRLAQRTIRCLVRAAMAASPERSGSIGDLQQAHVDLEMGFDDLKVDDRIQRLIVQVSAAGTRLGAVELPVVDRHISGDVVADAISARFSWEILRVYLERQAYPELRQDLAHGSPVPAFVSEILGDRPSAADVEHDVVGWSLLLQAVFGKSGWPEVNFYSASTRWEGSPLRIARGSSLRYELLGPPPTIVRGRQTVTIEVVLAGRLLGLIDLHGRSPVIRPGTIVTEVLSSLGAHLAFAVARAALVGPGWREPTLRDQLLSCASTPVHTRQGPFIARRDPYRFGSSSSQRSELPFDAEIARALRACGDQLDTASADSVSKLEYRPDILLGSQPRDSGPRAGVPAQLAAPQNRSFFDHLFATEPDPWGYGSDYEQRKYEQTLAMLPDGPIERCLEIGCAEGHFTVQLAPRVKQLVAADISRVALARAAERCAEHTNVSFLALDLSSAEIPGGQNVIVCSEILYYLADREVLDDAAKRIAASLVPGGHLVMAHAHLLIDDPGVPGFDWGMPFGAQTFSRVMVESAGLRLEERAQTPYYRIERYRRPRRLQASKARPHVEQQLEAAAPPPEVAQFFFPDGGKRPVLWNPEPVSSSEVPILTYHRVSDDYIPATRPWCVTPAELAAQMSFLAESGYHSITLEEWWEHANARRPLPGRAFILSFDDGYADFAEHAWPVLRALGFRAHVFLVTSFVGRSNDWDPAYEVKVPLMSWQTIRALEADGVLFGSHTASHQPLTTLTVSEAVGELVGAREALAQQLGRPLPAIAYPYGDVDGAIEHLAGACGCEFGLTCRGGRAGFGDLPIDLPRIDVAGTLSVDEFKQALLG